MVTDTEKRAPVGDWQLPNGMDLRHCHSLEVPLLHQFLGRWDLWSVACLVGLEVPLVLSLALSDLAVPQLVHGTPYLTLHQIASPCLSPCQMNRLIDILSTSLLAFLPGLWTRGYDWLAGGLERSQGGLYGCLCSIWKVENGKFWTDSFQEKLPVLPPAEEALWGEDRRDSLSSSRFGREIGRGMRDLLDLWIKTMLW